MLVKGGPARQPISLEPAWERTFLPLPDRGTHTRGTDVFRYTLRPSERAPPDDSPRFASGRVRASAESARHVASDRQGRAGGSWRVHARRPGWEHWTLG